MMLFIKILAPILVILISVMQFYLDHKYSDRRTNKHRRTKTLFLIVISIAMVFSAITIYLDYKSSSDLSSQIVSLKNVYVTSDSLAINREDYAKLERKNLINQIKNLQYDISPFLNLAIKKYPNIDSSQALKKYSEDIIQLKERASHLEDRTSYIESRTTYKSVDDKLREKLVDELKYIFKTFNYIKFRIEVENGNVLRQQLSQEIKKILELSGFRAIEIRNQTTFRETAPPSLVVKMNKSDYSIANLFFKPFVEYLFLDQPTAYADDKYEKSLIVIQLNGNPLFEKNGKVKF